MKRLTSLLALALSAHSALAGLYICKSESLTHTDPCGVSTDCPGNCSSYTWSRGYCGMGGFGDCYPRSAAQGGTATVTVVERKCTGTYGCACERGDQVNNYTYSGQVDQCSSKPFVTPVDPTPTSVAG